MARLGGRRGIKWLVVLALPAGLALLLLAVRGSYALFTDVFSNSGNTFNTDTLNPPTGLSATAGCSIRLNWTATADTYASGHRVFRSTTSTSGGPYTQIAEVTPRTNTTYTDNPTAGTYYYVVRAFYQNWESVNSGQASAGVASGASCASFVATADSRVEMDNPTTNFGTAADMNVDASPTKTKRSFLKFDVSSISAGSTVNSATLALCFSATPGGGAVGRTHELRLVTASWTETGINWNNQPAVSGTVTGTITVPSTASCVSWSVTGDVQAWVNGTATNNGWRVSDQSENATGTNTKYATREHGTSSVRPKLDVTYTPP